MTKAELRPARPLPQRSPRRALGWITLYVALAGATPAVAAAGAAPPGRGFWVEFAVALGFIGLAMLALQFVLTARFRSVAAEFGLDTMLHVHRQAGIVAFLFVVAHAAILLVAHPPFLEFLDPRSSIPRAGALWAVIGSLALLLVLTLRRRDLGLSYELWRASHGALGLVVVFIGLVHVLRVGHYVSVPWKQALWVGLTAGAMALLAYTRLLRPLRMRRRPWRVAEVRLEAGASWTVALEPVGHPGESFLPGQFAWLTFGDSPFSFRQHPFSFASAAPLEGGGRVEFTIKELGDFTRSIGQLEPGGPAWVDGPYGAFTLPEEASGAVFVAGGIGITPVMSMLRTLRERGDRRPLLLVDANRKLESVTFLEELDVLRRELNLRVVHLLEELPERPPAMADGTPAEIEEGMLEVGLLDRCLADPRLHDFERAIPEGVEYFVCGPEPMMNLAEEHLLARGVPIWKIHSERFEIA